jgi:uncharacterized protein (TIGR00297 family)
MKPLIAVTITLLLILRSYRRHSLTPLGLLAAAGTATIHALHPSSLPFTLLVVFFLLGTTATKVKHEVKSTLTLSSGGGSGGEGPRTAIQVLANSACASLLCLVHVLRYGVGSEMPCFGSAAGEGTLSSLVLVGVIANYVSVCADTMSSELGILSKQQPFLVTNPMKKVPKGTNGGVTVAGILYGLLGSAAITGTSLALLPFCDTEQTLFGKARSFFSSSDSPSWTTNAKLTTLIFFSVWGAVGSLVDSFLGAVLQASVVDRRTGKVIEGAGGMKVLTRTSFSNSNASSPQKRKGASDTPGTPSHESRFIGSGRDLLDNNQINFLMASLMSMGAMLVATAAWGVTPSSIV